MTSPFTRRPHSASEHFRLHFYGAVLYLRERLAAVAPEQVALLGPYLDELDAAGCGGRAEWAAGLADWEAKSPVRLPLAALGDTAGIGREALVRLFVIGLPEEDPRFGALFGAVQGGQPWPAAGLIANWDDDPRTRLAARRALGDLLALGLVEAVDPGLPEHARTLRPQPLIWDAVRGDVPHRLAEWARYEPADALPHLADLVLPEDVRRRAATVAGMLAGSSAGAPRGTSAEAPPGTASAAGVVAYVVVRGPRTGGRRTLLRALAAELGRGALDLSALTGEAGSRWRIAGPLATLLHALPIITLDPAPGETTPVPHLGAYSGPVGLRMPIHGGTAAAGAATLMLGMPGEAERRRHWEAGLAGYAAADIPALAAAHRMPGGTIRRVARAAAAEASADGRAEVVAADVARAGRAVRAELLDTLATRVPAHGTWDDVVTSEDTRADLLLLERRCRNRERLPGTLPPAFGAGFGAGVRAMFTGPSGTGKTLSARVLAAVLGKDLYRLDLSTVVNKYLGETEKNLDRVLGHAEALDVVLLVDEGDALLTRRTGVQTANDRYANLETDYLLQRLESFEGIVVLTTNAEQHIDAAFERRLDAIVDFPAPGPAERWAIWRRHLPAGAAVDDVFLAEAAARCALTGGKIRGAVLHASLLALDDSGAITTAHLAEAIRREYRKMGAVCPLRGTAAHGSTAHGTGAHGTVAHGTGAYA
ncbi:ATP-binding protein [Thermopolyspora sp. NPDC052614]|uniref:AAA family ATPase n=1 Tax=Thermopolyspora sp. NPDC052614 TaxID=3155682 RepID=UPI0034384C3A